MFDLNAAIIPGNSAGGFEIGMHMTDVLENISNVCDWDTSQQISEAIKTADGWLRAFASLESNSKSGGVLFSPGGKVELRFNSQNELYRIDVLDGYAGKLFDVPFMGRRLSDLQKFIPTEYDFGDELHYPKTESGVEGIAFYTNGRSLSADPEQIICGVSVFDSSQTE